MNSTTPTPVDLEAMAKMYYSDKISLALGSQFMAVIWDAVFIGILFGQTLKWIPCASKDALHIRLLVGFALVGCVAATIYTWKNFFEAFVLLFGTYLRFASWEHLGLYTVFNALTIIPIEVVFADRAVKINGNSKILAAILYSTIIATTTCTIGSLVTSRGHTMFDGTQLMVRFFLAQGTICAAMHLAVTGAIIYGLLKNREGSRRTNRMIDKIIMITLEGQIPGTIISFIAIILAAQNLGNPFIPWMLIVHPKFYMMGCLVMLNTRHSWSHEGRLNNASTHPTPHLTSPHLTYQRSTSADHQSGISANNCSHQSLSSNDSNNTLSVSTASHPQRVSVRTSTVQMFDDFSSVSLEKSPAALPSSTSSGFGIGNGTGPGAGVGRVRSIYGEMMRSKKEKEVLRNSASFGPIFSDGQLGSKISMV